jgi:Ca2+-binding EF-hand superfamily protein
MFARFDLNHDGFITKDEIASAKSQFAARMEQRRAEGAAKRASMFDRIDTNHDGVISRDEFAAAPAGGRFGAHMAGMHRGFGQAMFDMADTNKDARVSLAEAQQLALQHFDRADLNHDGVVSPEERKQAHQLMRAQRHPA